MLKIHETEEDFDFEKIPDSFDVPYFQYALDDGIFAGISKRKKQFNSNCYIHSD